MVVLFCEQRMNERTFSDSEIAQFKRLIWDFYAHHKRDFPWRETAEPYHIFISEVMLQQTQAPRVIEKYKEFIQELPNFNSLASAPFDKVLRLWQGLGYNRRAKYLQEAAKKVVQEFEGTLPQDPKILATFPGIGAATSASICAFAFNEPVVFIETNIRRVYIHHFFNDAELVSDKDILPFVKRALDAENPREWYWALMDYGTHLAKTMPNPNRRSKHYTKQTKFAGSNRQLRGAILKTLLNNGSLARSELLHLLPFDSKKSEDAIEQMIGEGFLKADYKNISLVA